MANEENKYTYIDEHILKAYFQISEAKAENKTNEGSQSDYVRLRIGNQVVDVFKRNKDGVGIRAQQDTDGKLKAALRRLDQHIANNPVTVFIVYGHGDGGVERKELRDILEDWNFKPIFLDKKVNYGDTIIEKLERYMETAKAGIILATPDDIGHANNEYGRLHPKYRVRQNVVLETGMVLSLLGRKNTIILSRDDKNRPIEFPGDLDGVVRVQFETAIEEVKTALMDELFLHYGTGYATDIPLSDNVEDSAE